MDITLAGGIGIVASIIGLAFAVYQGNFVLSQPAGNEKMQRIAAAIQRGAQAFLRREYTAVTIFVIIVAAVLFALSRM